ncbi:MAG: hypothetical protein LKF96_08295 [Treponema sp.]|jgi:hypothetical protein|nr:hypothetical protein [Treponema sp.]
MHLKRVAGLIIVPITLLSSCVTVADYNFSTINRNVSDGDYAAVYNDLERNSTALYSDHDAVLEFLDKGIVSHFCGNYDRSNEELSNGEKKIEEYYAKSISQTVTSFVANDTVTDYSGDTYEDIYINIFKALNYIAVSDTDDAFVEIRRFDNKLKTITQKYQVLLAQQKQQMSAGSDAVPVAKIEFYNSALARYLSMLLYRAAGDRDSALVDKRSIEEAFKMQPALYKFPVPQSVPSEISVPAGMARLNIISFTGRSPVKYEKTIRVNAGATYYKLALPEMVKQPSLIVSATVTAISKTDGAAFTADVDKLESIEDIALDTFEQKYALLFARSLARSIAKAATTQTFDYMARKSDGNESLVFSLLKVASAVTTEATERADVRTSRFFPATAGVAGITVKPGFYDVVLRYYGVSGNIVAIRTYPAVSVSSGNLNLIESVCQQ